MLKSFSRISSSASRFLFSSRLFGDVSRSKQSRYPHNPKWCTAEEAMENIKSFDHVFVHSCAAAPQYLVKKMTESVVARDLRNVIPMHVHTEGVAPYADPKYEKNFRTLCLFIASNLRKAVNDGRADFVPVFLSEIPVLFRKDVIPVDVAMVNVSPPDSHGYCSLGISVEASLSAVQTAKYVIAQVNPLMPRTLGDGIIHISQLDALVEMREAPPLASPRPLKDFERKIGKNIAQLIPDEACLQMGIGAIPDAVLFELGNHKNLGIHTEMFSNGVVHLVEKGVITNKKKRVLPGQIAVSFVMGDESLYKFVDDNPQVYFSESNLINDPNIIRRNPKQIAINSSIEIDLTGQVVSDSMGTKMYSGVGGQVDFVRGASLSEGGKSIIGMPSVTSKGETRIVPTIKEGGGVVTTRAHVRYVATEYGVVDLHGRSILERAKLLISISHPKHREELTKVARERFGKLVTNVF